MSNYHIIYLNILFHLVFRKKIFLYKEFPNNCTFKIKKGDNEINNILEALNELKVKLKLITDGDVSGALLVSDEKYKVDIFLGIGGGPEGVLAAAALKCLNCQMQTRLVFQDNSEKTRAKDLGINDLNQKYNIEDMIKDDVIFCATGVTDGDLVKGIKNLGDSFESETYVLQKSSLTNKIVKNIIKK